MDFRCLGMGCGCARLILLCELAENWYSPHIGDSFVVLESKKRSIPHHVAPSYIDLNFYICSQKRPREPIDLVLVSKVPRFDP